MRVEDAPGNARRGPKRFWFTLRLIKGTRAFWGRVWALGGKVWGPGAVGQALVSLLGVGFRPSLYALRLRALGFYVEIWALWGCRDKEHLGNVLSTVESRISVVGIAIMVWEPSP